nr:AAA family ATPase [Xanthomonas translucens]
MDLATNGLMCLVGRNGAGKTTLVRALKNLSNADTFVRTATPYAFSASSRIVYDFDGTKVTFSYDGVSTPRKIDPSITRGLWAH